MMDENESAMNSILSATQCRGPLNLPVWVPQGVIETLAEHIGVMLMKNARDQQGLKIAVPIQIPDLPDIAREALRKAVGATHIIVEGEPDPNLRSDTKILRGFIS